jgi:hypothetical protein
MVAGARLSQHHGRDSSFAAVVLTGAEAIQTAGMLKLRERGPFGLYGSPTRGSRNCDAMSNNGHADMPALHNPLGLLTSPFPRVWSWARAMTTQAAKACCASADRPVVRPARGRPRPYSNAIARDGAGSPRPM